MLENLPPTVPVEDIETDLEQRLNRDAVQNAEKE